MQNRRSTIETLTWKDVREDILKVNPKLATVIDDIDPGKEYLLYRVKYPFGSKIIDEGTFCLPNSSGQLLPISHPSIAEPIRKALQYSNVPLGLIQKKATEVYFETTDRIFPLRLFNPGVILGLWESLDPLPSYHSRKIWTVSSGARSTFLLPKIADASCFKHLRQKYHFRINSTKEFSQHWKLFNTIAKHHSFPEWHTEILFFSNKWAETRSNKCMQPFRNFLLEQAWFLSRHARNASTFSIVWGLFVRFLTNQGIKPNTYLMDSLIHLLAIASGTFPGFKPSDNSRISGPYPEIQKAILDDYGLKTYVPTIMRPSNFSINQPNEKVYYSLQYPTLLETFPKTRNPYSVLSDLRELKKLIEDFTEAASSGYLRIEDTSFYDLLDKIKFDYFHSDSDGAEDIRSTKVMPKEDAGLIYMPKGNYGKRRFSETNSFVRGCIRISTKQKKQT